MLDTPRRPHDIPVEELARFQADALAVLQELCPDRTVSLGADAWSVRVDALHVGLHNAVTESRRQNIPPERVRDFLRQRFAALLIDHPTGEAAPVTSADARTRLLPQFMPAHYVRLAPMVSFPFHENLDIGLVIDSAKTYRYALRDDLAAWDIAEGSALELAVANLEARSRGIPVHLSGSDGPEKLIALETRDGFDAARILIPEFQRFVADHLGDPFRFAIPNRDFLICWAATNSAVFHHQVAAKVAQDFSEQAYSLSPCTFRWTGGRILKDT